MRLRGETGGGGNEAVTVRDSAWYLVFVLAVNSSTILPEISKEERVDTCYRLR